MLTEAVWGFILDSRGEHLYEGFHLMVREPGQPTYHPACGADTPEGWTWHRRKSGETGLTCVNCMGTIKE